jgi:hypothetical protein
MGVGVVRCQVQSVGTSSLSFDSLLTDQASHANSIVKHHHYLGLLTPLCIQC